MASTPVANYMELILVMAEARCWHLVILLSFRKFESSLPSAEEYIIFRRELCDV